MQLNKQNYANQVQRETTATNLPIFAPNNGIYLYLVIQG